MAETIPLTILARKEDEAWNAFERRVMAVQGEAIAIVSISDVSTEEQKSFLEDLAKVRYRVRLATRDAKLAAAARKLGITVYTTTRILKQVLKGHPELPAVLRMFSPHLWRQQWRTHLQYIGLLSLPKLRIWALGILSVALFTFVIFRLLPSADVQVVPRQETIDYTTNIVLAETGTTVDIPSHVRTMPLMPFRVVITRSLPYDQISQEFIGTSATAQFLITNADTEEYSLRKGTRLTNQAGMVFRIQSAVTVHPGEGVTVRGKADPQDLYGETIGERGNVPAGLRWDFPGLTTEQRKLVYAKNTSPATGGKTASRQVLQAKDLQTASELLKAKLTAEAQTIAEERRQSWNLQHPHQHLEFLRKDDVIKKTFSGFILPLSDIGKPVTSITVQGSIQYTAYAYDVTAVLNLVKNDIISHTVEDKRVILESLTADRLRVYIIDYDDSLAWIKITADLLGLQEFVLDPLTPVGARFAKRVRETVANLPRREAERILRNFPEVERVSITLWPPWSQTVPSIPSHISISFP